MKRTTKIIIGVISILTLSGAVVWYVAANKPKDMANSQSQMSADAAVADDSKFAKLKGEDFDEAYIADMIAHHEGAVNMAEMVNAATQRQELRDMAQDIMKTQSQEILDMRTWQTEWGYEQTMGGHGSHSGQANDMAGDMMDMGAQLTALKGSAFDEKFLELMIVHHEQAVEMSKYADTNAAHQQLKNLAAAVISAQEKEIKQMKQWQKEWGYSTMSRADTSSDMSEMGH